MSTPGAHKNLPVAPTVALLLAPAVINLAVLPFFPGGRTGTVAIAAGLTAMWLLALAAWAMARSVGVDIGLRAPDRRGWLVAAGLGVALMLAVPLLSLAGGTLASQSVTQPRGTVAVVLAGVLTAAITEEVLFRGAGVSTFEAAGLSTRLAAALSLGAFALAHLGSWPISHVLLVTVPLGAALTWCFVHVRNLPVVMVAHAIIDAPLVVFAAAG